MRERGGSHSYTPAGDGKVRYRPGLVWNNSPGHRFHSATLCRCPGASNPILSRKLEALEKSYDAQFKVVFDAIRQLMSPPTKPRREIGFHVKYDDDKRKAKKC